MTNEKVWNVNGTREIGGKPPRHYFYPEGLLAYLYRIASIRHSLIVSRIDNILTLLNNKNTGSTAETLVQLTDILTDLREFYAEANPGKELLSEMSYVVKMGADKYSHKGYQAGMDYSLCISSFMGHFLKSLTEENDQESGLSHLLHAGANILILMGYINTKGIKSEFNDIPRMFEKGEV